MRSGGPDPPARNHALGQPRREDDQQDQPVDRPHRSVEGQQAELLREWNGNLVTNYRFAEGRVKGLNLGGNVQYRGSAVIGSLVNPTTGLPDFANPLKGAGYTIVGVHARYERRIFRKYDWHVSLHVRNLLNEDRLIEKSASATDGAILIYDQLEPQAWLLSTGVRF